MGGWKQLGPRGILTFPAGIKPETLSLLRDVAGCRPTNKNALIPTSWHIPDNALRAVLKRIPGEQVTFKWIAAPQQPMQDAALMEKMRSTADIRPWVPDFLTSYQREGIAFACSRFGAALWHPTGSGKTLSALIACAVASPGAMVIVTRAASRLQYAREAARFLDVRPHVISSTPTKQRVGGKTYQEKYAEFRGVGATAAQARAMWKLLKEIEGVDTAPSVKEYAERERKLSRRPVVVVSWESLGAHLNELLEMKPSSVVFDEAHRAKSSRRYHMHHLPDMVEGSPEWLEEKKKARELGGFLRQSEGDGSGCSWKLLVPATNMATAAATLAAATYFRISTTATPVKDRIRDLWGQLDLIEPNCWGSSTAWRARYCDMKPGQYGGMDDTGQSNIDELNERIARVAHIVNYRDTHRLLPAKRRQSLYVAPGDQVQPAAGFAAVLKAARGNPSSLLEAKLALAATKKSKAVLSHIESHFGSKHKVVLFTGRREDCESLGQKVTKLDSNVKVWFAHGGQDTAYRQAIVDEYMAHPGPCALIGTGAAFGESLNLQDTDAAFFVMLPYTPGELRQWEGRFCRFGQKRPVIIYYVIAEGTVDEHVATILLNKLPAVEQVAQDDELAEAARAIGGNDVYATPADFAKAVLAMIDDEGSDW